MTVRPATVQATELRQAEAERRATGLLAGSGRHGGGGRARLNGIPERSSLVGRLVSSDGDAASAMILNLAPRRRAASASARTSGVSHEKAREGTQLYRRCHAGTVMASSRSTRLALRLALTRPLHVTHCRASLTEAQRQAGEVAQGPSHRSRSWLRA